VSGWSSIRGSLRFFFFGLEYFGLGTTTMFLFLSGKQDELRYSADCLGFLLCFFVFLI
jgi:hypothetical protein